MALSHGLIEASAASGSNGPNSDEPRDSPGLASDLRPATVSHMSKSLTLEIPGDVANALRVADLEKIQRLRLELSVSVYSQGILGLGKSAQLAGLSRPEMNRILAERKVPMHYGPEELAEDLQYGRGEQ